MHNPAVVKHDMHVISGGQTGVDLAALRAAQCFGLKTGGLAPLGFKTTAGPRPQLKTTFRLEEAYGGYADRTRRNVERAHATLILAKTFESPGTKLTIACAQASGRPVHQYALPDPSHIQLLHEDLDRAVEFIAAEALKVPENESFILNVAGNSSYTVKNIFFPAFITLAEIFTRLAVKLDVIEAAHVLHVKNQVLANGQLLQALNDNFDYHGELDPRGMKGLVVF
jgi:hypothetical protein